MIPSGNLAEVRFEDLEADPAGELERIYRDLSLPGWTEARPKVESYLHSINGYKKNRLSASPEVVEMVNGQLGFIQNEWGYPEADI